MSENFSENNFDYRQFFEMSPDLLCMLGADGFFKVLNEKWTSLLGYSTEELTSTPFIEFVHPDDHASTAAAAGGLYTVGSELVNFTNRYICKNGDLKWISWSAVGVGGHIYSLGRDITDLKSKSIQFDAVQSTAKIGAWLLNAKEMTTEWTSETYRIHEVAVGTPTNNSYGISFFHPDDRARATRHSEEAIKNLKAYDEEFRLITGKGKPLWVRVTGDPVINKDGEVTHLRGIFQDITEKKNIELEIESQRAFLQSIITNIPAMIFAKSASELRFTLLNQAGENLLGLSEADILGKNDYDFFPKEQADSFTKQDREALSTTGPAKLSKDPIDTKNGRRWLQSLKVPVKNQKGEPELLLGISMDITAQVALEDEVKKQQSFATHQSKLAQLGQLAAGVGHEINNPLAIAAGNMDLIQKRLGELGIKDERISDLIQKHKKST